MATQVERVTLWPQKTNIERDNHDAVRSGRGRRKSDPVPQNPVAEVLENDVVGRKVVSIKNEASFNDLRAARDRQRRYLTNSASGGHQYDGDGSRSGTRSRRTGPGRLWRRLRLRGHNHRRLSRRS